MAVQLGKTSEVYSFPPLSYQLHLKYSDLRQLKKGTPSLIAFLPIKLLG